MEGGDGNGGSEIWNGEGENLELRGRGILGLVWNGVEGEKILIRRDFFDWGEAEKNYEKGD